MRRLTAMLVTTAAMLIATPVAAEDDAAVQVGASYITDVLAVVDGGAERGIGWLGRGDLTVAVDGRVIGLDGVDLFADLLVTHPGDFSGRKVGDFQTVSNVQADSALRPFEFWATVPIGDKVSVKAGLVDLNTEFDIQRTGALFINSSHGIGPDFSQSGANGPSIFPAAATALIFRRDGTRWRTRVGVFDAIAGSDRNPRRTAIRVPGARGALVVAEVERAIGKDAEIQVGAWRYTGRSDPLNPAQRRAISQGAYALIEGPLAGKLDGWIRIGAADARANPIAAYIGGGIAHGPETSRVGLAIAHARLGGPARRNFLAGARALRAETAIELTWARQLTDWVTAQADVQYIVNPSWDATIKDALVTGLRLRFQWLSD